MSDAQNRNGQLMRYKIVFPIDDALHHTAALADTDLDRAIGFARRISEGEWYEVIDTATGCIAASSKTSQD